jgi:capsular polysaccharide biosynthesis protein
VPQPQPRVYGTLSHDLHAEWPTQAVPGSVFELPDARLLGPDGCIVTSDDTLLVDHSFWGWTRPPHPERNQIYQRKKAQPVRRVAGRVLSLGTDFGIGSFGHLVHDGLTRLPLVLAASRKLTDFDWLYLPRPDTPAVRELETLLEFPREKILNWDHRDLAVEHLTATSFPGEVGRISIEGASWIRDRAQACWGGARKRRIYLTRRGYRRTLTNEAEITAILAAHGFETIDPSRELGVLEACANAEVIAGVDGSNMANLAFAPAGGHILEFMPPQAAPVSYHSSLAISGGRRLSIVVGTDSVDPADPYLANFRLPPERLRAALADLT